MKFFLLVSAFIGVSWGMPVLENPMDNPDLFEGDLLGIDWKEERNAVPKDSQRWPNGVVSYVLDASLAPEWNRLKHGMDHIAQKTCIKFVERTTEEDFVKMFAGRGCFAHWGKIGGQQSLSLGSGCLDLGTVVHELLHTIGFQHEHNRSDRDDYLNILWDNIEESRRYNFHKLQPYQNRLLTSFDFDSVMLYGNTAFSKSSKLNSMVAKDGRTLEEVYNKPGMSTKDITRVKMLYNC